MDFVATIECARLFVAIWLLFVLVFAFCSELNFLFVLSPVYTVYDVHDDCYHRRVLLHTCIYICKMCFVKID